MEFVCYKHFHDKADALYAGIAETTKYIQFLKRTNNEIDNPHILAINTLLSPFESLESDLDTFSDDAKDSFVSVLISIFTLEEKCQNSVLGFSYPLLKRDSLEQFLYQTLDAWNPTSFSDNLSDNIQLFISHINQCYQNYVDGAVIEAYILPQEPTNKFCDESHSKDFSFVNCLGAYSDLQVYYVELDKLYESYLHFLEGVKNEAYVDLYIKHDSRQKEFIDIECGFSEAESGLFKYIKFQEVSVKFYLKSVLRGNYEIHELKEISFHQIPDAEIDELITDILDGFAEATYSPLYLDNFKHFMCYFNNRMDNKYR